MSKEISIPDAIYRDVEQVCQRIGLTPEEFIADAAQWMARKRLTDEEITARLDEIYATEDSSLDPIIAELQAQVLGRNEW
jgi:N-formylglutamate amidohydrolase